MKHTRALGEGHLQHLLSIIAGAGLLGAITNTKGVVLALTQALHIARLAVQLGGLVVHVVDTHGLVQYHISICNHEI